METHGIDCLVMACVFFGMCLFTYLSDLQLNGFELFFQLHRQTDRQTDRQTYRYITVMGWMDDHMHKQMN